MRKARFLLALSIVLVISIVIILIICLYRPHEPTTTLKVVLIGPYVLVWSPSHPNMITAFSPRDPKGLDGQTLHRFYANNLLPDDGINQNVHVTLKSGGLRPAAKLSVDPYYPKAFIVDTEKWADKNDYLVKIELPLPEKITFASPLSPVTLDNGARRFMATNFILEYRVTDPGKIEAKSDELGRLLPLPSSDLLRQYEILCQKPGVQQHYDYQESCASMRNLLEKSAESSTALFVFGVGIPLTKQINMTTEEVYAHAADFFNNFMLQSFPKWNGPRLSSRGPYIPEGTDSLTPMLKGAHGVPQGSTAMLMETSYRPAAPHPPLLLPVTAVIDCKAGNVIVTAQTTTTQQ